MLKKIEEKIADDKLGIQTIRQDKEFLKLKLEKLELINQLKNPQMWRTKA